MLPQCVKTRVGMNAHMATKYDIRINIAPEYAIIEVSVDVLTEMKLSAFNIFPLMVQISR